VGIFSSLFQAFSGTKKPESITSNQVQAVIEKEITSSYEDMFEDMRRWEREQERLREEGREARRNKMAAMGVDVALFSEKLIVDDSLSILSSFIPSIVNANFELDDPGIDVDFANPTKTGKLPKNVARAHFVCEPPVGASTLKDLTVELHYLSNASVNKAEIYLRDQTLTVQISVRRHDDAMQISRISRWDRQRDVFDVLWSCDQPEGDQITIASNAITNFV